MWEAIGIANDIETHSLHSIGQMYLQGFAVSIDILLPRIALERKEKKLLERAKLYILREDENVDSHLLCVSKESQDKTEEMKTKIKELARALEII